MMRTRSGCTIRYLAASVIAAVLLSNAGCRQGGLLEKRLDARAAGMERSFGAYLERESGSPGNLESAGRWIGREFDRDVQRTGSDFRAAGDYFVRDTERWIANQPLVQRTILRLLWGKPETIEHTAVRLFP